MKSPEGTYHNTHEHLSEDQLIRYLQDKMDNAERQRVELHLLECELCSEAVEGMEQLEPNQAESALHELKGRLSQRLEEGKNPTKTHYWNWGIAASVLLFAGALFFLLNSIPLGVREQENEMLVQQEPRKQEQEGESSAEAERAPEAVPEKEGENRDHSEPQYPEEKESPPIVMELEIDQEEQEIASSEEEEDYSSITEEFRFEPKRSIAGNNSNRDGNMVSGGSITRPSLVDSHEVNLVESAGKVRGVEPSMEAVFKDGEFSADRKMLKGKVTDSSGDALPGVSVRLAGSDKGTMTDLHGEYSLPLPARDTTVHLSFIGFEPKKLAVPKSDTQLLAVMNEDVSSLSEVVVIGYGEQRRSEVTGAVRNSSPAGNATVSPPKPAAGMRFYNKYLRQNRRYTAEAKEAQVEGVVVVEFYVEPDSTLSNFKIQKSLGYGLDEEAIRLLKEGPAWQPATAGEKTIRQKFQLRVPFRLD